MVMENTSEEETTELHWTVVSEIFSRLFLDDIVRARSVGKTWHSVTDPVTRPSQWLMNIGQKNSPCRFYNPVYKKTYLIDLPELSNSTIRFSNAGWLLVSKEQRSLFFFNPFTKEKISLPDFPIIRVGNDIVLDCYLFTTICFTSSPTSVECMVENQWILTISRGDDSWKVRDILQQPSIDESNMEKILFKTKGLCLTNPVLHNGLIYGLAAEGQLGVFRPNEQIFWRVLDRPGEPCGDRISEESCLMECNGKLVSVFVGKMGEWVLVFMLDEEEMCWEKVDDLRDYMLFVSHCTSFSAKKEVQGMENKIYFPRLYRGEGEFYCLKTKRFRSFGGEWSKKDLYGTMRLMHSSWMELSSNLHTKMELDWIPSSKESFN